ncbi:phospholipase D, putative [Entamoeba invadens IP1]|uniref:phospholipase D, putative n=1 Tax=Entamoeba invadens IP1 TaxID=370355 RepID=UPI0002C3DBA8|nr:phospholipase D, putative [Entamoeba invadens IP1]ELP90768.1 phospholipase D, putative [Entamoeba invadens IP1]|eukprot:XP_004257539.1 phospholipase D, putative [Entamoeba invadens IP1]
MKKILWRVFHKKHDHRVVKQIVETERDVKGIYVRQAPVFAVPSNGNKVTALVDGEEAMCAIAEKIVQAKEIIYITDWQIDPDVVLVRNKNHPLNGRTLVDLLKYAASNGVTIKVLLYNSPFFHDVAESGKKHYLLEQAHPNIECKEHRWMVAYTHHQKTVVVDHQIAFLGGLDLAHGRWDTNDHSLSPNAKSEGIPLFMPSDFYNTMVKVPEGEEANYPRLPWHDLHCMIEGPAVFDVDRNFVERWNRITPIPEHLRLGHVPRGVGGMSIQIVRSICKDAGGNYHVERGCYEAVIRLINRAEDYVYIEQQFFISNYGNDAIWNLVVSALADKVIDAFKLQKKFRVMIVLPAWSEGELQSIVVRSIMQLIKKTIFKGKLSLFARLTSTGIKQPSKYVGIFNLYSMGRTKTTGLTVSQIYVHSKCLIVDDRYVFISSANINDRSLIGERDTEIGAIVVDSNKITTKMNGKFTKVNKFAFDLRTRLWGEHLGLLEYSFGMIEDPVETIDSLIIPTARQNTKILEENFENYPSNAFTKFKDWKTHLYPKFIGNEKELVKFRGHIVEMPLDFGLEEGSSMSLGNIMVE